MKDYNYTDTLINEFIEGSTDETALLNSDKEIRDECYNLVSSYGLPKEAWDMVYLYDGTKDKSNMPIQDQGYDQKRPVLKIG